MTRVFLLALFVASLFGCTSPDRVARDGGMDAAMCGGCSLPPLCGEPAEPCSCGCVDGQRFGATVCVGGCRMPVGDAAIPPDATSCDECLPPPLCGNPAEPCSCSCMPGQRFGALVCGDGCLLPAGGTDAGTPRDGASPWTSCEEAHGRANDGDPCTFIGSCGNCCCEGSTSCADGVIGIAHCECLCIPDDAG